MLETIGTRMLLGAAVLRKTYLYAFGFFQTVHMREALIIHIHTPKVLNTKWVITMLTQTKIKDFVSTYKENNDYFSNYMTEMMIMVNKLN